MIRGKNVDVKTLNKNNRGEVSKTPQNNREEVYKTSPNNREESEHAKNLSLRLPRPRTSVIV